MKLIATNCAMLLAVVSVLAIMQTSSRSTTTAAASEEVPPQQSKKVIFEKLAFDTDPEWVIMEEAITKIGEEDTALNIQMDIKKSIPDSSLINIELAKEKVKDEYSMILKSGDVSVCGLLKNATTSQPMIKAMILKFLEYTNIPYQCPLPVGQFWLKEFVIDPALLPDFLPEGRYKVNVGIYQPLPSHKLVSKSEIIFSLTKKL